MVALIFLSQFFCLVVETAIRATLFSTEEKLK